MSQVVRQVSSGYREPVTHLLCFPLYNSRSSSQLHSLVQRLREDDQAAGCSQKAFDLPQTLHLPIARFTLKDPRDVYAASALLRSFNVHHMLRDAASAAAMVNAGNHAETSTKETVIRDEQIDGNLEAQVPPLCVSLIGLKGRRVFSTDNFIGRTYGNPIDYSNRLHIFANLLVTRFALMGMRDSPLKGHSYEEYVAEMYVAEMEEKDLQLSGFEEKETDIWKSYEARFLCPRLINRGKTTKLELCKVADRQEVYARQQSYFDARGLVTKYEGVVLADNLPLEKLSLWQHHEEVASIPLPLEE